MIDRKQIETLISAACDAGAKVTAIVDAEGYYESILVSGLKGVGPYPMAPVAFGETVRKALAERAEESRPILASPFFNQA